MRGFPSGRRCRSLRRSGGSRSSSPGQRRSRGRPERAVMQRERLAWVQRSGDCARSRCTTAPASSTGSREPPCRRVRDGAPTRSRCWPSSGAGHDRPRPRSPPRSSTMRSTTTTSARARSPRTGSTSTRSAARSSSWSEARCGKSGAWPSRRPSSARPSRGCRSTARGSSRASAVIEVHELEAQKDLVLQLLRDLEPMLDDPLHERVTRVLEEWTVLSAMQTTLLLEDHSGKG